jgi:hypothetical protein
MAAMRGFGHLFVDSARPAPNIRVIFAPGTDAKNSASSDNAIK